MDTDTHIHTHALTHALLRTYINTHAHTHTWTHTNTHTRWLTHAHTHTYTLIHTYTVICMDFCRFIYCNYLACGLLPFWNVAPRLWEVPGTRGRPPAGLPIHIHHKVQSPPQAGSLSQHTSQITVKICIPKKKKKKNHRRTKITTLGRKVLIFFHIIVKTPPAAPVVQDYN